MPSRVDEHNRMVRCAPSGCRSGHISTRGFIVPALLGSLLACEPAHSRIDAGAALGYTSGIFCATPDGLNHNVDCGCPGAPCDDGDPATRSTSARTT